MNANELANYLEKCISNDSDIYEQAATMLRQQHAEIDALKKKIQLHKNAHHEALKFAVTPLTDDECESIINKHDWFSKSWCEMAKEIHDAILKKASK